jgi:hypothetical protein
MSRYLFILLLIVSIGLLSAVESDPSETVGYFKLSVASNSWQTLSVPFYYTSLLVQDVIGDQFAQDDVIQDVYTGTNTTYYDGFGWFGDLESLSYGSAYWVYRAGANPGMDYFVMGTVDAQPVTVHVYANGWSAFSLNDAAPILIENITIAGAAQDDVIQDVYTGTNTTYYDGFGWFGDLVSIDPTHAYWYYTTTGTDFEFTYTPPARNGSAAQPVAPDARTFKTTDSKLKK